MTQRAPGERDHDRPAVVDADIHPRPRPESIAARLPQPWRRRYAGGNHGPGPVGYYNPNWGQRPEAFLEDGTPAESSPEGIARNHLDPQRITHGILNVDDLNFAVSPELDFGAAMARAINDTLFEEWLPADARYRASVHVAPTDPNAAAAEIRRVGTHPGAAQVYMPAATEKPLGHRSYNPIYQAAADVNLPVAIHPGVEGNGLSHAPTAAGYPGSYLEWHTGLVATYVAHLVSLIAEGTFQRYPTLRFTLIEGGVAWLPPVLWRLDKNWKALRQVAPWLDRLPSEIAYDHVRLTTQPLEEPENPRHLEQLLEMFPADRMLMFSSDFPHWDGDTPDFTGRHFNFKPGLRDRVLHGTARELYRLPGDA